MNLPCVGGYYDGKWYEYNGTPDLWIPMPIWGGPYAPGTDLDQIETYHICTIHTNSGMSLQFWKHTKLTDAEAVKVLIDGYWPVE